MKQDGDEYMEPRSRIPPRPHKDGWSTVAIVVAVVVIIGGLVMLGVAIAFFSFINSYGSNK